MCHRWKRPFLCHGVFKSSTIHFRGKMGKQRAISPITSLLPRLPRRNSMWRDSLCSWFCLSIHWFECQFVSRAATQIRCKQKKRLENGGCWLPLRLPSTCAHVQDQVVLSLGLTLCQWRSFHWTVLLFLLGVWLSRTGPQYAPLQRILVERIWCKIHPLSGSPSYKYEFWTHFPTERQCNIYLTLH